MQVLLFEDSKVRNLTPITTARPAMAITVAGFRLIDLVRNLGLPVAAHVRPHLATLFREDFAENSEPGVALRSGQSVLLLNGRLVPSEENLVGLKRILQLNHWGTYKTEDGSLAAALITSEKALELSQSDHLIEAIAGLPADDQPHSLKLLQYPHEVIAEHMRLMADSLAFRLKTESWEQLQDGVFVREGVSLGPHTVFDTSKGPILFDHNVKVGPFCYFRGPIYAAPQSRIIEYASLKDGVAIGHTTKIGGEVEASIVEPFTNKQHHGFLGHSYLGSWINLGAGTCNSDLKNTYGLINMDYEGVRIATNMQFVGCFMGDYTKSAINTGIFTGKVIGVCSMLYGFITTNVPSFVNYARLFGQVAELPAEVMIASQARMFSRRNVTQRECDRQLIRDMYQLTTAERDSGLQQLAGF